MNYFRLLSVRKNIKAVYYLKNYLRYYVVPKWICEVFRPILMNKFHGSDDEEYIANRVNYYNRIFEKQPVSSNAKPLSTFKLKGHLKAYFFDAFEIMRYFPQRLRWNYVFGDVTEVPSVPSFVKSRPIDGDSRNSIVLKLDKQRHFVFFKDPIPFAKKIDKVIFRGKVDSKDHRARFMELYAGNPRCDVGDVSRHARSEWGVKKLTLLEHLDYKFIMSLEGNDVASNLKWVMSSNSLAVMPRPTYETWFMEGTLIPNVHYVEIKSDYSDLEERMDFYINHPDEAQKIIDSAHRYVEQFFDNRRERLISLIVAQKYFELTDQI